MKSLKANKGMLYSIFLFCLVHVYGTTTCPYCKMATNFLRSCKVKFVFHDIRNQMEQISLLLMMDEDKPMPRTVPQIFICDEHIGGNSEMTKLHQSGELKKKFDQHGIKHACKESI